MLELIQHVKIQKFVDRYRRLTLPRPEEWRSDPEHEVILDRDRGPRSPSAQVAMERHLERLLADLSGNSKYQSGVLRRSELITHRRGQKKPRQGG